MNLTEKDYVVIVQCHIVKERCSGYLCEMALNERSGGFAAYSKDKNYRHINLTCGGCCGRGLQRKLINLKKMVKKKEGLESDKIVVQFSSCITKDNHHGPRCPHFEYLTELVEKLGLDWREDTRISKKSEELRQSGLYQDYK